jgi:acetyl esterase/lipase
VYDNVISSSYIPEGITRTPCDLGSGLKAWWFMSDQLRHQAEAARFILYIHGPNSSPNSSAHRALASRLALDAGAAVLMVDYSRTPEYTREQAQEDINKAYRWAVVQPGVIPASMLVMADGLGCA